MKRMRPFEQVVVTLREENETLEKRLQSHQLITTTTNDNTTANSNMSSCGERRLRFVIIVFNNNKVCTQFNSNFYLFIFSIITFFFNVFKCAYFIYSQMLLTLYSVNSLHQIIMFAMSFTCDGCLITYCDVADARAFLF